MLGSRSGNARLQSDFYRDKYRKMLNWLIICVFIILVLTTTIIYLILFNPSSNYYGNTIEGSIMPMPPHFTEKSK